MRKSELHFVQKSLREVANLIRGGHICREKADSLLDLHKITQSWKLPEKRVIEYPEEKWCSHCGQLWLVRVEGYNCTADATWVKKTEEEDGLQPWCRNCAMAGRSTDEYKWTEFRSAISKTDPASLPKWSAELYEKFVKSCNHKCTYCNWDVRHWGNGYSVDRVSSVCGYDPNNTTLCCWPCNKRKADGNAIAYRREVEKMMEDFRPTRMIRWDEVNPNQFTYIEFGKDRVSDRYVISKRKPVTQRSFF